MNFNDDYDCNDISIRNDDNLCIVTLTDLPEKMDKLDPEKNGFSKAGLLEQVCKKWENL